MTNKNIHEAQVERSSDNASLSTDVHVTDKKTPAFDIHAEVLTADDQLDEEWFDAYCEEILRRFSASPEAQPLDGALGWADMLMVYSRDYQNSTVATMTPDDLYELVFEIFPRKVSCDAQDATSIIQELRAFWKFLEREFSLGNAQDCLKVLAGNASSVLEQELSNPNNFGMAKSFFLSGQKAGFDVSTEEGMSAWVSAYNAASAGKQTAGSPPPANVFSSPPASPEARRALRNKRKAQRTKSKKR
jgi:hypothetical protein